MICPDIFWAVLLAALGVGLLYYLAVGHARHE